MNKKFLSAILFGALAVTSTGSFVSCKDYDDDIDNLQTQINGLASAKDLSDKVSALQSAISSAQTAAEAKAAAAQAVADAAKAAAEKAGADAKAANDAAAAAAQAAAEALDAAVAVLEKDINDVKGAQAAAEEACKKALDELQAAVDKAATKDELKAAQDAQAAVAEGLENSIKEVKASVEELASTKADKKDLEAAKDAALAAAADAKDAAVKAGEDAAAALKASEAKLNEAVAAADAAAKKAQETADKANAAVAELEKTAATKEELAAVAAAAKKAQEAADAAKEDAAAVAAAAQKAQEAADKNAAAIAAQAKALAAKADAKTVEGLDTRVKALEATIKNLASEEGVAALAKLAEELGGDVEDIQAQLGVISKRLTSLVFAPTTYINGIETIEFESLYYLNWGNKPANWLMDNASYLALDAENKRIEVAKVDGKEAYECGAWEDPDTHKWYACAMQNLIGDGNVEAQYLVSPSLGVTLEGIDEFSYLENKATNATRAIGKAPIEVVGKELKDGVLTLKLAKTESGIESWLGSGWEDMHNNNYPTEENQFSIVSLKATLNESVLTDAEKEAGAEVNVYSDWTRLTETAILPLIANSTKDNRTDKGVLKHDQYSPTLSSHFYAFSQIYGYDYAVEPDLEKSPLEWVYYTDANAGIAASVCYKNSIDLLDVVTVCGVSYDIDDFTHQHANGRELKNYAEYGLEFEFSVMPYLFLNEAQTEDATPQEKFAKLEGSILTPTSRDGQLNNADAIGRTPVIQAVLKDTKNDAVVDVRYFKIQWVENIPSAQIFEIDPLKPVAYDCEGYTQKILEETMNKIYANVVDGGMSPQAFHSTYTYPKSGENYVPFFGYSYTDDDDQVHSFTNAQILEMLQNGDEEVMYLQRGIVRDLTDASKLTQTHNIQIYVNAMNPEKEQDFEIKGVFAFYSESKRDIVLVPVTIPVKAGTIVNTYGYNEPAWNVKPVLKDDINKTRPINPTLISDLTFGLDKGFTTTQLIADITYGYMANNKTPKNFKNLLGYKTFDAPATQPAEELPTDVIFDEKRLETVLPEIPVITTGSSKLKVAVDGDGNPTQVYKWGLSDNKKVLSAYLYDIASGEKVDPEKKVVAARIGNNLGIDGAGAKFVFLVDQPKGGDPFSNGADYDNTATADATDTSNPSEAALLLVGKNVPVMVTYSKCDVAQPWDQYLINFIKPLKWNDANATATLKDMLNYGDAKEVTLASALTLQEAFGSRTKLYLVPTPKLKDGKLDLKDGAIQWDATKAVNADLNKWYGLDMIKIAPKSEWLINLAANGEIVSSKFTKLADHTKGNTEQLVYDLNLFGGVLDADNKVYIKGAVIDAADGVELSTTEETVKFVEFHNHSGQAITKNLKIQIPVVVDTKWEKNLTGYITVVVEPNLPEED